MGGVGQRDDAADLVVVDEARAGVQVGDDGDAQAPERGWGGAVEGDRMLDQRQAVGFDPEGIEAERDQKTENKSEDGQDAPGIAALQNWIRARLSSDTALVPVWPA
jgi:hypothetical protein